VALDTFGLTTVGRLFVISPAVVVPRGPEGLVRGQQHPGWVDEAKDIAQVAGYKFTF